MRTDRAALVVTPEHVLVRLVPAGLGSRFLALAMDLALVAGATALLSLVAVPILPRALGVPFAVLTGFVLTWGYHVACELRRDGRTFGKGAVGLRVVDGRGLPLTRPQSFVRNVVRVLDFLPFGYGLGAACAALDRHHRRLGDLAAGTLVVLERGASGRLPQLPRSPRFNSLRTPRVKRLARHRIDLEEREFLLELCLRAERLDPRSRLELMEDVGAHYRSVLEIDDPHLSGESLVRDLAALLFATDDDLSRSASE